MVNLHALHMLFLKSSCEKDLYVPNIYIHIRRVLTIVRAGVAKIP